MNRYLIVLVLLVIGCTKSNKDVLNDYQYRLALTGELSFPLDSLTTVISTSNQLFTPKTDRGGLKGGQDYLCYLSRGTIQFYDYDSKKLSHVINFKFGGENGIASNVVHFNVVSLDSIFISAFPTPFIYRVNDKGEVQNRYMIGENSKATEAFVSTSNPIIVSDDQLFLGFYTTLPPADMHTPLRESEMQGTILQYSLANSDQRLLHYLPELYGRKDLWSQYYYIAFLQKGLINDDLIIGFGADDSITVTNFKDKQKRYYAGSRKFDKIPGLKKNQPEWDHYRLNYIYQGIIADKYRNCYYRFVGHPKTAEEIKSPDMKTGRVKDISVITMDENFTKIAETLLPAEYSNLMYFVSEEGLHIYNIQKALEDEDNLHYGIFKLTDK